MKYLYTFFYMLIFTLILGGCATKFQHVPPPEDFLHKKEVSIALIWTSSVNIHYPEGPEFTAKHHMLGNQGLLDIVVARSFSDKLISVLGDIKIKDLMHEHYFNVFKPAFEDKGFNVIIKTKPYCHKKYRLGTNEYCTNHLDVKDMSVSKYGDDAWDFLAETFYDYKPVINELDVDYLLVIQLERFGTGRSYFAAVPTSPPKGVARLVYYLIDTTTEKTISKYISSVVEPVQGEWDQEPEYPNLVKTVNNAFEIAIDEVFIDIFKHAP